MTGGEPLALHFADDGSIPNHPWFPVLHYRAALTERKDLAAAFEALFEANHWPPQWRAGVYPFHHYHASSHEAFGIACGSATLLLGGERGRRLQLAAGDVLVLPAGTGHCGVSASADFVAVGPIRTEPWWTCIAPPRRGWTRCVRRSARCRCRRPIRWPGRKAP